MPTVRENVNTLEYKLLSGLVRGNDKKLEDWYRETITHASESFSGFPTSTAYEKYLDELGELFGKIKAGQNYYRTVVSKWNQRSEGDIVFPDMYDEYRKMIYKLQKQQSKVAEKERRILREKEAARSSRGASSSIYINQEQRSVVETGGKRAPRKRENSPEQAAPSPEKKSSGWKRFLTLVGLAGAFYGVFQWGKNAQQNSAPHEGDKVPDDKIERRESPDFSDAVARQGNIYVAETPRQMGKRVITDAMNSTTVPVPTNVHEGRLKRQRQQLEEARLNAANAREVATTTASLRQSNDNVLGMDRDEAYTGAYVSGQKLTQVINERAIRYNQSPITTLTDTLNNLSEAVDAGTTLINSGTHFVKGGRNFKHSIKGHSRHGRGGRR